MKVDQNPIKDPKYEGAYRVAAVSGLLTGVAAGSASAGHLFALRWAPAKTERQNWFVLQRLYARLITVTGFTAAQEVGMDLSIARSYSARHSGGNAVALVGTPNAGQKRSGMPTSIVDDMRIGSTGALTNGTETLDAAPIASRSYADLAAAATVAKGACEIVIAGDTSAQYPIVLAPNEGLVLRNTVAMGAGGTCRLVVELDWLEIERY